MTELAMAARSGGVSHPARAAFTRSSPVEEEKSALACRHDLFQAMARSLRATTFPAPDWQSISCHQAVKQRSPTRRRDVFPPPLSGNIAHFRRDHKAGFETRIPSIFHAPRYGLAGPAGWPAYRPIIRRLSWKRAQHDDGQDPAPPDAGRVQAVSFL